MCNHCSQCLKVYFSAYCASYLCDTKCQGKPKFCLCSVVVYILLVNKFNKVEKLCHTAYCGLICVNEITELKMLLNLNLESGYLIKNESDDTSPECLFIMCILSDGMSH
jgi:hypothetical protein